MRGKNWSALSDVLEEAVRRWNLAEPALEARAVQCWPEVVGAQMARASRAERIIAGTLHVTAVSDAWHTEISFLRPLLLRKYRERLGEPFVKAIRVRVGRIEAASGSAPPPPDEEVRRIRLPEEERARIEAASRADDPELSQAIRRALTREAQLRVWRLEHGARACTQCGCPFRSRGRICPACRGDARNRDAR